MQLPIDLPPPSTDCKAHVDSNFILNPICAHAKHNGWPIVFVE